MRAIAVVTALLVPAAAAADVVRLQRSSRVYSSPEPGDNTMRGVIIRQTRVEVLDRRMGRGCREPWLRIGEQAWICGNRTQPAEGPPGGHEQPGLAAGEVLPHTYVITRDATVFPTLQDAAGGTNEGTIAGLGGFRVRAVRRANDARFVKVSEGWVPEAQVQFARPSNLAAVDLAAGDLDRRLGFVRTKRAHVVNAAGHRTGDPSMSRQTFLASLGEPITVGKRHLYPIGDGRYLSARDVGRVEFAPAPEEVTGDEFWLDVSLSQQTMVAYRGSTPVFATMVSTGRTSTPTGVFRIEKKRATVPMKSRPEHRNAYNLFTPWVMTLHGRIAMHAVYWHDDFGTARSHGCVNLSPIDAKRIWDQTEPRIPDGWIRIDSTEEHPGTVVRVRD